MNSTCTIGTHRPHEQQELWQEDIIVDLCPYSHQQGVISMTQQIVKNKEHEEVDWHYT